MPKSTDQRQRDRAANRVRHVRTRAQAAGNGHQLVVVACNAALATSRRVTDDIRRTLAREIASLVERYDTPTNHKERS
jgi:hypothetical protein